MRSGELNHLRFRRLQAALAVAFSLATAASFAAERVRPTLELASVRVEVTWVADNAELAEIRRRYETPAQRSRSSSSIGDIYANAVHDAVRAFSVLGKRNDEWVCLIFAERPMTVNDARMLQLGHELGHCLLGAYH
jgi:hypothetical protein